MTHLSALAKQSAAAAHSARQIHLSRGETVNLGAYYTAPEEIRAVWRMLEGIIPANAVVFDNACGYGGFLRETKNDIGCDIDKTAAAMARIRKPRAAVFCANALEGVSRRKFNIAESAPLVMVGNPPYNDRTSQIRKKIKTAAAGMDEDIRSRDAGISFLRSYDKLRADLVCVLHPLSYLIKRANFARLGGFAKNYVLLKAEIFSSARFPGNSQTAPFPVVAALYARDKKGMSYGGVCRFRFRAGGASFSVGDFQYLVDFVQKYPQQKRGLYDLDGIMFYTMRDINALRRNRTFIFGQGKGGVHINRAQLPYYIYADAFKQHINRVPYYFGNSDIMINDALFTRYNPYFLSDAARRHPLLKNYIAAAENACAAESKSKIEEYFRLLLGAHYEN